MDQKKEKASLEVTMSAAQASLLKRIDELRRYDNHEAADTWQKVYTKLYGDRTDQAGSRADGFFQVLDIHNLKPDFTD